ncbi:beta-1,4-xylanase from Chaetomium Thermophilum complexed with methyl Thioxylopentoside [Mycena epipterygia]|nr:beta-1,4-xylanase from Chaetomium Thermophilum complexed with methyl Thioxylopentoside [Mycena epipterygia]
MVSLTSLLSAVTLAVVGVSALPGNLTHRDFTARAQVSPGEGTFDDVFYSFFTAGTSDVTMTNIAGGQYEIQWDGSGDFVAGQGTNPGSTSAAVTYSSSFEPNADAAVILSVYGWSENPLVEYYINEFDSNNQFDITFDATFKGTVTSDGSVYNIYEHQQVNQPSIQGTATFNQYISVRQSQRTSGTVTVANHVNAWRTLGMDLGTMNYQIMAVEGLSGSGQATVTVQG